MVPLICLQRLRRQNCARLTKTTQEQKNKKRWSGEPALMRIASTAGTARHGLIFRTITDRAGECIVVVSDRLGFFDHLWRHADREFRPWLFLHGGGPSCLFSGHHAEPWCFWLLVLCPCGGAFCGLVAFHDGDWWHGQLWLCRLFWRRGLWGCTGREGSWVALGPVAAAAAALFFGWFCVRLSGVYLAMLTMAAAQILWGVTFQWQDFTGGDDGILGVWPAQ